MGRIIFMTPFSRMEITGGIKTNYQHVELLAELGFDACIYQPDGQPKWFKSGARNQFAFNSAVSSNGGF